MWSSSIHLIYLFIGLAIATKDVVKNDLSKSFSVKTEFPDNPLKNFVSGVVDNAVISVKSNWEGTLEVLGVSGSFRNQAEPQTVLQNLPFQKASGKIAKDGELVLNYKLKPHAESQTNLLILNVEFTDGENKLHYVTVHNGLVTISEPYSHPLAIENLFMYGLIGVFLYAVFLLVKRAFSPQTVSAKKERKFKAAKKPDSPQTDSSADPSWIPEHHFNIGKKRQTVSKKESKKVDSPKEPTKKE